MVSIEPGGAAARSPGQSTGSRRTHRWREMDSNHRYRIRNNPFWLPRSVPQFAFRNKNRLFRAGDRWFESISLQRRVSNELYRWWASMEPSRDSRSPVTFPRIGLRSSRRKPLQNAGGVQSLRVDRMGPPGISRFLTSAKYRDPLNLDQHLRTCETSDGNQRTCRKIIAEDLLS